MAATKNPHRPSASSLDALPAEKIGENVNHYEKPSAKLSLGEALGGPPPTIGGIVQEPPVMGPQPASVADCPHQTGQAEDLRDPAPRTPDDYRLAVVQIVGQRAKRYKVVSRTETIREYHARITSPDTPLAKKTAEARALLGPGGEKTSGFDNAKSDLPQVMPAVDAPQGTPIKGIPGLYHNGLYGYDIDQGKSDWDELQNAVAAMPAALFVAKSSSANGLYAYIAGTLAETPEEYRAKWYQCRGQFPKNIHVSTASNSNEINRVRFVCHDPDAYLAETVIPADLDAKAKEIPAYAQASEALGESQTQHMTFTAIDDTAADDGMTDADWVLHGISCENGRGFRKKWDKIFSFDLPDLSDQSDSTYDASLAATLVAAGWGEPEENYGEWDIGPIHRALLDLRRAARKAGRPVKAKYPAYFLNTIRNAIDFVKTEREAPLTKPQYNRLLKKLKDHSVPQDSDARKQALALAKRAGLRPEDVEGWVALALGSDYDPGEVERVWDTLPEMDLSALAAQGYIRNGGGPFDGRSGHTRGEKKAKQQTAESEGLPAPEWWKIGRWVARKILADNYYYDRESNIWWGWRGTHWKMLQRDSHELADNLLEVQYLLAHELRTDGALGSAELVAKKTYQDQVRMDKSPLWGGCRAEMARTLELPPNHIVAVANGVLDLLSGELRPHDPRGPYLVTAVTRGCYLPDDLERLRAVIDARLEPALPREEHRTTLYKCLTLMMGGQAGGLDRGSLLFLLGKSGGGKGNTARVIRDSFGDYAMVGNIDSIFVKGEINEALARILEANPRIVIFHEVVRVMMAKVLSMTGSDDLSARGPHKATVERRLNAGVVITAVDAPKARMDTGASRRMVALWYPRKVRVPRGMATDKTTQCEADALTTVVLHDALTMWQRPEAWDAFPETDADTTAALKASDAVEDAICTLTDFEVNGTGEVIGRGDVGKPLTEIIQTWKSDSSEFNGEEAIKNLTARALSARLSKRDDWKACTHREKGPNVSRLYRPDGMPGQCPCNPNPGVEEERVEIENYPGADDWDDEEGYGSSDGQNDSDGQNGQFHSTLTGGDVSTQESDVLPVRADLPVTPGGDPAEQAPPPARSEQQRQRREEMMRTPAGIRKAIREGWYKPEH